MTDPRELAQRIRKECVEISRDVFTGQIVYAAFDDDACASILAAEMPRWVPVEDRLPEKDGDYMVVLDGGRIESAFHFWERFKTFREDVTHWQELPALPSPPREEAK